MHFGDVEGREVASERGIDAALAVGVKIDDSAGDDGVFGQQELIVGVDGVEKVGADRLAFAHGVVPIDGQGEWRARRDGARRSLTQRRRGQQGEYEDEAASKTHVARLDAPRSAIVF